MLVIVGLQKSFNLQDAMVYVLQDKTCRSSFLLAKSSPVRSSTSSSGRHPGRALRDFGRIAEPLVIGKGESPCDMAVAERIAALSPAGLILADFGTRPNPVFAGCPTLVIDHHVPTGEPQGAITISGNGLDPEPTTALLAWWAATALGDQLNIPWLSTVGLIGDMAEERGFPELVEAQARWADIGSRRDLKDAVDRVRPA